MTTALKTVVHRRGTLRNTEHAPYHQYNDPDTNETIVCIHHDRPRHGWRASTPQCHGHLCSDIAEATEEANTILRNAGYAEITTPGA